MGLEERRVEIGLQNSKWVQQTVVNETFCLFRWGPFSAFLKTAPLDE